MSDIGLKGAKRVLKMNSKDSKGNFIGLQGFECYFQFTNVGLKELKVYLRLPQRVQTVPWMVHSGSL